jgi:hypothetical protein
VESDKTGLLGVERRMVVPDRRMGRVERKVEWGRLINGY